MQAQPIDEKATYMTATEFASLRQQIHDLNNSLTAVLSFARFLEDDLPEGSASRDDATEISTAAKLSVQHCAKIKEIIRSCEAHEE